MIHSDTSSKAGCKKLVCVFAFADYAPQLRFGAQD